MEEDMEGGERKEEQEAEGKRGRKGLGGEIEKGRETNTHWIHMYKLLKI